MDRQVEELAKIITRIEELISLDGPFSFMEVCGTHTVSIFQSGLRDLFPSGLRHISGPGCPVCVTHAVDIALGMVLALKQEIILATFGDMMRVPDAKGMTLKKLRAQGARVSVCYSPLDALRIARDNPSTEVVFWGIGFETTSPTVAATIIEAKKEKINNFSVLCAHKLIPPALEFLLKRGIDVDGFLLPGHVSTVIGTRPYEFIGREYGIPAVVAGFEPLDIAMSILGLLEMRHRSRPEVTNEYFRVVKEQGNIQAQRLMEEVFEEEDALWRGIGIIGKSGFKFREKYREFDAKERFSLPSLEEKDPPGCRCGEVLQGKLSPNQCPLFGKKCTPLNPVGPCMVSSEGSCAAYYKYGNRD